MDRWKIEKDFVIDGFRCVIVGQRMGYRCGYVEIPADHKYYGVEYDKIDVDVHGDWTYSGYTHNNYPAEASNKSWWIGFDCGHLGDAKDLDLIKSFGDDELTKYYVATEERFLDRGTIRTFEYVENELIEAVKQLKNL